MALRKIQANTQDALENRARFWLLRTILASSLNLEQAKKNRYVEYTCELLGISEDELNANRLKELLSKFNKADLPEPLRSNLTNLKSWLGLNELEVKFVELMVFAEYNSDAFEPFRFKFYHLKNFFAKILEADVIEVSAMLENSILFKSGLLDIVFHKTLSDLSDLVNFSDRDIAYKFIARECKFDELFEDVFTPCSTTELKPDSFSHMGETTGQVCELLRAKKGVNILIYGTPGTGKTEFVKLVAKELNRGLYEVAYMDRLGSGLWGSERMKKLVCANNVLSSDDILLFDEVEDVFKDSDRVSKALINRCLENNTSSVFWLTNKVWQLDSAYVRRFDMVLEFKTPPKQKRLELLKQYAKDCISDKLSKKLAKSKTLSPALICNVASNTKAMLGDENDQGLKDKMFLKLLKANLKAQSLSLFKKKADKASQALAPNYSTEFINSSLDLAKLAKGIASSKSARICIYGASGTGKSEYAKYLAKQLKADIIIKNASDLLGSYVGQSERNIANAFRQAKEKKAVLVFDEVDSFLSDRAGASYSWERTLVNEMLTQMQSFEGVFVATTNLKDSLDKAALRRFDIKLEFGYLKPAQASGLFKAECESLGLKPNKGELESVGRIANLANGDFNAVRRQAKFCPIKNAKDFISRLRAEAEIKDEKQARRVGF